MAKPDQIQDARLRQMVTDAFDQMRANDPTQAVHSLAGAFMYLLEIKPEIVEEKIEPRAGWKMPFLARWPQLGVNWKKGSLQAGKPEFEFVRDHFALSEAITYYEFTLETAINRGA